MAVGTAVCTFRDSLRLLEERKPCGVKWEPNVEDGQVRAFAGVLKEMLDDS